VPSGKDLLLGVLAMFTWGWLAVTEIGLIYFVLFYFLVTEIEPGARSKPTMIVRLETIYKRT
jgi:hypothetical protein